MNPKDHKIFIENIAEEAGVSNEVVKTFINFYYSKVRMHLSDLTYPRLYVEGLGSFCLRKGKLMKSIKRNRDILGNLEKMTYKGMEKHVAVKEKVKQLEKALKKVNDMQDEKQKFRDRQK